MAISEAFSGSATISTTETSLVTNTSGPDAETTDGVFQVFVDFANLAAGDSFRLRYYEKARSGDTQRLIEEWIFDGAQSKPLHVSPSFIFLHGWDVTLIKLGGTDRTITWSIRKVA